MADKELVSERLRAYVRERVRRDGKHYVRGANARLARHLKKPTSWVSEYADPNPDPKKRRHADLDEALEICELFRIDLLAFRFTGDPKPTRAASPTLSRRQQRVLRLLAMASEDGQRKALGLLASIAKAFPRGRARGSRAQDDQSA